VNLLGRFIVHFVRSFIAMLVSLCVLVLFVSGFSDIEVSAFAVRRVRAFVAGLRVA
jgi:hypothetical protein